MMRLTIAEPEDPAWLAWRKRCTKKTNHAIEEAKAGRSPVISELYKEPKELIFKLFGQQVIDNIMAN